MCIYFEGFQTKSNPQITSPSSLHNLLIILNLLVFSSIMINIITISIIYIIRKTISWKKENSSHYKIRTQIREKYTVPRQKVKNKQNIFIAAPCTKAHCCHQTTHITHFLTSIQKKLANLLCSVRSQQIVPQNIEGTALSVLWRR